MFILLIKFLSLENSRFICPLHESQPCHGKGACVTQWSWAIPCSTTKDGWVIVKSSDKCGLLEEGMATHSMDSMKRQKDMIPEDEPHQVSIQYATGGDWKAITNSSRKNVAAWPKQKWYSVVNVSSGESEEQYCIGTWNVKFMNQGFEVVRQEMAGLNINILGISELKWMGMGEFNSADHCIYYCRQEFLRKNEIALIVNTRGLKCSTYVQSQKKGNAKESPNYYTIILISHANKLMFKHLQARLEQLVNWELSDVQAVFLRSRGTRDQIANVSWHLLLLHRLH